jgi:hypothetical protein
MEKREQQDSEIKEEGRVGKTSSAERPKCALFLRRQTASKDGD